MCSGVISANSMEGWWIAPEMVGCDGNLDLCAEQAFKDGVLDDDVIPLCAANAAQDKGSARQALRYLCKADELPSKTGKTGL